MNLQKTLHQSRIEHVFGPLCGTFGKVQFYHLVTNANHIVTRAQQRWLAASHLSDMSKPLTTKGNW